MKFPFSSRITTSLVTRSTWTLKVGFSGAGFSGVGVCAGFAGAGACAERAATKTTAATIEVAAQKRRVFFLITRNYTSSVGGTGAFGAAGPDGDSTIRWRFRRPRRRRRRPAAGGSLPGTGAD